ncbi:MAG: aryl-sulfate sulfotransferase [Candidatus Kapabacteria bacterium]|nr:aryl-sulfate sulfotransferase [Ignavibacteriota bacterium]MCW5884489.1 aryl-sulfate sulfotransferase [Candidatus Kapabacteria bacterium]
MFQHLHRIITFVVIFTFSTQLLLLSSELKQEDKRPFNKVKNPILLNLPDDFPEMIIDTVNNPANGNILMECFQVSSPDANYIMILDNEGNVVWYDKPENQGIDFKVQPNGRYSYASRVEIGDKYQAGPLTVQNLYVQHMIMNEEKQIIDSVQMQNEYLADIHEFRILPNGNYLLIAYERVPIDMSEVIPGGDPNATIVGTVIQELDKNKECVYQWRSLDFIPVLATKDDVRKAIFEHVHGNSLFMDRDGHVISTFPTTFEIVKIDMITGELIWRLGGDNSDFEITGENEIDKPYYFRMQHDAKILPNGNLLFYDNAVQKTSGWSSRAVEYSIDEAGKTAHLVWEYKHNPPISAFAMGSAQRLDNGNTLINWGLMFTGLSKGLTEVTPDKDKVFELTLPKLNFSYRAQKIELPACQPIASVDRFEMMKGNTYKFDIGDNKTGIEIYFKELDAFLYNMMSVKKYNCAPLDPEFEGEAPVLLDGRYFLEPQLIYSFTSEVRFDLNSIAPHISADKLIVFSRDKEGEGIFIPHETRVDAANNKLIANTSKFGEYVIGFLRDAEFILEPRLMYPHNDKVFNNGDTVRIVWSSTGRFDDFQIQISNDNSFSEIIFDSVQVKSSVLYKADFEENKEYFWRVKTSYRDLESGWSSTGKFSFFAPFLSINYPAGGEILKKDTTVKISWNTNSSDSLSLELLLDGSQEALISEGIFSHFNAMNWKIPNTLPNGVNYTVKITDKISGITTESNSFAIQGAVSVDENTNELQADFRITPNPANEYVQIYFNLPNAEYLNIAIYDVMGFKQQTILNTNLNEGAYSLPINITNYPAGVYYCILKTSNYTLTQKIVVIR